MRILIYFLIGLVAGFIFSLVVILKATYVSTGMIIAKVMPKADDAPIAAPMLLLENRS